MKNKTNKNNSKKNNRNNLLYYKKSKNSYKLGKTHLHKGKKNSSRNKVIKLRRERAPIFRYVGEDKAKISINTIITIVLIFSCALGIALSFAILFNKQLSIANLNTELRKLQEKNLVSESQILKSYDIKEVEKIATINLKMGKPKPHQIIYIDVPKQSYAVQYDSSSESLPEEESFTKTFFNLFKVNKE